MNEWTVLSSLREITPLDENGAADALPLCRTALQTLLPRLKPSADPEDIRIAHAAAGIAYYKWVLRSTAEEDNLTSFKAGDVTVSRSASSALERAAFVRNEALLEASALLLDENFAFCSV